MGSPANHREHVIDDGRGGQLLVRDWGPLDGRAIVFHHGTPSSSLAVPGGWTMAGRLGVRIVTFDRPGYGRSTAWPGRSIADAALWTERIADHLGLETFAVMGTSGGGPHAVGTASQLADRVTRLCVSVGLGPVGTPGFDELEGLPIDTRLEVEAARRGEAELHDFISTVMAGPGLDLWLAALPESDREVLARAEVKAEEAEEEESWMAAGTGGWAEDDLATFARPWECDASSISVPTLLVYGESDVLVPLSHGRAYVALLPHATLVTVPDVGHWMRDYEETIVSWLVRADGAEPVVTTSRLDV